MMHILRAVVFLTLSAALFAQFRGGSDWSTNGGDAQRSSWVRTDPKISPASVAAPGFQLEWKVKLGNEALAAPVLLDRYIGYRGFRTYAFVGGSGESAFALDSDLGRVEWQKRFTARAYGSGGSCPGGTMAQLTRPVGAAFPSANAGRFGGGRGGPAKSGVGEPLEGAVTLAQIAANRPPNPPPPPVPTAANRPAVAPAGGGFGPRPTFLYGLSSDGDFHIMYVSNGEEAEAPIKFLPPNASVSDLSVVDGVAYATTTNHCGGVPDGVWALDLTAKTVTNCQGSLAGGEAAFGPSGAYLTAGSKLVSLDQKTLAAGATYDAGQPFSTAPLAFEYKGKTLIAAATKDGAIHLVDTAAPSVAAAKSAAGDSDPYALASWQTVAETRWIIATGAKSITAWKIADANGALTLQPAWSAHNVSSSSAPLIINGVLFALQRGDPGHNAILFAFDAATGKELWNSGNTIGSFVAKSGGLAAGGSSIYLGTNDGTLWAFGFPIEH
jgi:outer membrane protein assembly factor BamB